MVRRQSKKPLQMSPGCIPDLGPGLAIRSATKKGGGIDQMKNTTECQPITNAVADLKRKSNESVNGKVVNANAKTIHSQSKIQYQP